VSLHAPAQVRLSNDEASVEPGVFRILGREARRRARSGPQRDRTRRRARTRVAGTRVCALLGCDQKGSSFSALFTPQCRREIEDIIGIVAEEMLAAVAGITATAEDGSRAHLELLLLPFNNRAHTPLSLTGLLAPFGGGLGAVRDFDLTSWRYIGHPPQRFGPRVLRKLAVARGFMVYEGLR
jgi:hypothetical protein